MIAWIDLETTGLDEKSCSILEIAMVLTDDNLNEISRKHSIVTPLSMENLDPVVLEMHTLNDLFHDVRKCSKPVDKVTQEFYDWLYMPGISRAPLAGSSVHFDRVFLREHMPVLEKIFYYRNLDVSSIDELAKRWNPDVFMKAPNPPKIHRAMDDVLNSIEKLKYYRQNMLVKESK